MHLAKEYIGKYNKGKEEIKNCLQNVETNLDALLPIKNIKSVKDCEDFLKYVFSKKYELINVNIDLIIELLNELQKFCHEDIKTIIPFISSLKEMDTHEAFRMAKNIDWLIETIKQESELKENDKLALLEISEFNKKVRYFIHSTLAFCQNPLPYQVRKELKTNIKNDTMTVSANEMYEDICYCLSESNRIKKAIEKFHILSNVEFGNWESVKTTTSDILKYFDIYKNRFEGYYYKGKLYNIKLSTNDLTNGEEQLEIPLVKVKEVIDVLLHNAAEELVEKEISNDFEFDKSIECTIEMIDKNVKLSIKDNGRGIKGENLEKAFISTKQNLQNYGIGLDIANRNVKILKGSLENYENEEEGVTFVFTFPSRRIVEQEGFKQKINVLVYGNYEKLEDTVKELNTKYDDIRIIKHESLRALKDELSDGLLSFINIIIKDDSKKDINNYINEGKFKGQIIKV